MIVLSKLMVPLVAILFGHAAFAQTQNSATLAAPISHTSADTLRKYSNQAFGGGEYLRFDVNYEFITVGEAVMREYRLEMRRLLGSDKILIGREVGHAKHAHVPVTPGLACYPLHDVIAVLLLLDAEVGIRPA